VLRGVRLRHSVEVDHLDCPPLLGGQRGQQRA
jgi:hypothetical protein